MCISIFIFFEAYTKFAHPQETAGGIVALVALAGIFVNTFVAYLFRDTGNDLNQKAAFVNMALDVFASVATLIGGVLIYLTHSPIIDPIISIIIASLLLYNSWEIIRDVLDILLETAPRNINSDNVKAQILTHECVREVVDLHIWSLSSEYQVLTAVLNIHSECTGKIDELVEAIKQDLITTFDINHLTIETRIHAKPHVD